MSLELHVPVTEDRNSAIHPKSTIIKRSVVLSGKKTSLSVEDEFWTGLKEIATAQGTTISEILTTLSSGRKQGNFSSCLRLFVLDYYVQKARVFTQRKETEEGPAVFISAPP